MFNLPSRHYQSRTDAKRSGLSRPNVLLWDDSRPDTISNRIKGALLPFMQYQRGGAAPQAKSAELRHCGKEHQQGVRLR